MAIFTNALTVVVVAMGVLYGAYKFYGNFLAHKVLRLDDARTTPAVAQNDGLDFVPTRPSVLFGHHFASIAGLAPIVGPAIAVYWGWLPALIWVLIGCTLIGAVHDMAALFSSMRNKAKSIGGLTSDIIGPRARLLFLLIIFFLLALAMGVFAILMAGLFVKLSPEAIVPTFSLILIAMVIGTLVYKVKLPLLPITIVGVTAMFVMLFVGMKFPVCIEGVFITDPATKQAIADVASKEKLHTVADQIQYFEAKTETAEIAGHLKDAQASAVDSWVYILLVYALLASILPVWLLLQPRDYINCFQLYAGLGLLLLGFIVWHPSINAPAVRALSADDAGPGAMPMLFITIACGAVSGFHSLVASGTTARQIRRESDARVIAYGGMLTEGLLAVFVIIACVAGFTRAEFDTTYATYKGVDGLSAFLTGGSRVMAAPFQRILSASVAPDAIEAFFRNLVSVMVVSFAMTTLDSGTRLLRYNIEELGKSLGLKFIQGRYVASLIAVAAIGYFALMKINGKPAGLTLWQLFGTSNQMLATLGLLVASVYLYQLRKPVIYTLIPMFCMLAIVVWAITIKLGHFYHGWQEFGDTGNLSLLVIGSILAIMAGWTMIEAVGAFLRTRRRIAQGTPTHTA